MAQPRGAGLDIQVALNDHRQVIYKLPPEQQQILDCGSNFTGSTSSRFPRSSRSHWDFASLFSDCSSDISAAQLAPSKQRTGKSKPRTLTNVTGILNSKPSLRLSLPQAREIQQKNPLLGWTPWIARILLGFL